jgi:hypothetical protein
MITDTSEERGLFLVTCYEVTTENLFRPIATVYRAARRCVSSSIPPHHQNNVDTNKVFYDKELDLNM